MNETTATIVTTPVPMYGYEDAVLGGDVVSTRLHFISQAFRSRKHRELPEHVVAGPLTSYHRCSRHYYVKTPQTAAIECYSVPLKLEPAPGPANEPAPECEDREYLDAVYEVHLSFSLAALRACAKGELTRPIVLHGISRSGRRIDIRSGRWIIQPRERLERITADPKGEKADAPGVGAVDAANICTFLEEVYRLAAIDNLQSATDRVFDHIDQLLCAGSFDVCDEILKRVDVARLPAPLLRSFLTITAAAKEKLPARQPFFVKAEQEMARLRGPEMAKRLLGRLA